MNNRQSNIQTQEQIQALQQHLSAQQVLQVKMLEMPLVQLEEAINAELCDNPALEVDYSEDEDDALRYDDDAPRYDDENANDGDNVNEGDNANDDDQEKRDQEAADEQEREDRSDALDDALNDMGLDDTMESDYRVRSNNNDDDADREEIVYGDSQSFYDKLNQQVSDEMLTEQQSAIMQYLIGSLDGDGFLRKNLGTIAEELAIYEGIDCTLADVEEVLEVLQGFDPAGLGARSLQECLMLQIKRRPESQMRHRMGLVINNCYDAFTKKHWNKIASHLGLTEEQVMAVVTELRRLNPRPGAALGETMGRASQQVTPDFIVDTAYDGTITLQLNNGNIPRLYVSADFEEQLKGYQQNQQSLNRMQKEALLYTKEKVERARGYIEAVRKRQQTLTRTMQTIIDIQQKFFRDGDEADLVPMTLKDVADVVGVDLSTVSRVCNSKYVDTQWGVFRLRHFFSQGYTVKGADEDLSTRKIKVALKEIIDKEDKRKPLADAVLSQKLKELGYPIARRTVAKYREQLGYPIARLRR